MGTYLVADEVVEAVLESAETLLPLSAGAVLLPLVARIPPNTPASTARMATSAITIQVDFLFNIGLGPAASGCVGGYSEGG